MRNSRLTPFFGCLALAAALAWPPAAAAQPEPEIGQKGKDVVWIPSPTAMVDKMLDMARVTPQDYVIDLGSGDGRNVIAAARRGARALGVEYEPNLVEVSKRAAAKARVGDRASFVRGDMFEADISQASVLVLFLIPSNLERLAPKFLALAPGTRIVSNTYEIGGDWEPDETDRVTECAGWCVAHLYVVPAKVAGTWRLGEGELTLYQNHQLIAGTYAVDGAQVAVEGRLRGTEIRFNVNGVEHTGRVTGDAMEGVAKGREATRSWRALRPR